MDDIERLVNPEIDVNICALVTIYDGSEHPLQCFIGEVQIKKLIADLIAAARKMDIQA